MKLVNIQKENENRLGVKTSYGIIDVQECLKAIPVQVEIPKSMDDLFVKGKSALENLNNYVNQITNESGYSFLKEEDISFGPAVHNPSKIICVGLNYKKHAEESNMPIPEYPILFNKFNNTLIGHDKEVTLPTNSDQVDYECELAIIIGKTAKKVTEEEALDYVVGYSNANDLSARDLQFRTNQWLLGKCCDDFSPIGPYVVTSDEVGDPNKLQIKTLVNGVVKQDSNTEDMIFNCKEIVSYISNYMTLNPGDVILTGTPEGVILGYPENQREWLKSGDEVIIEIEKLGQLKNIMK
ncbi:fumarylacetoacetate hydrolase family protein [Evansella sp. AB-P1]|uniref:fumarylacetoacetate hydrolase family protein n=1 Tax=Evansella sp. AB-P1 TaxID=3037653 RepID=UPI00241EEB72|nr:fumarylacetoacetate hydrolase family protein [Evansella sp. AB-P1]MDG5787129.1 fumarylacetoacetate hydrolase family protein [Evansella sp. AB-P1]